MDRRSSKRFCKTGLGLCLCLLALGALPAQDLPYAPFDNAFSNTLPPLPTAPLAEELPLVAPSARWFAGADYRLLRTHFSEAVAFATLTPTVGPSGPDLQVVGHEVKFDYQSAFAAFGGYHLSPLEDIRFTYSHLDSAASLGGTAAAGQFIVDPIGNIAVPGQSIQSRTSVGLNVFDLEYLRHINSGVVPTGMTWSAGLRFANVRQFFQVQTQDSGSVLSDGVFRVAFFGVGPYGSLTGRLWAGESRRLSLYAKGGGALLVGKNHITTDVSVSAASPGNALGAFSANQDAGRILVAPVLEAELGASWTPSNWVTISCGYMVQAWTEFGISGASFSGERLPGASGGLLPPLASVFSEADDTSIMGFEGLFMRALVSF